MLNNTEDDHELGSPVITDPTKLELNQKTKEEKEKVVAELVGEGEIEIKEAKS